MRQGNNFLIDSSNSRQNGFFKSRRFTVFSFLFFLILVISLGVWQLKTNILQPFKGPENTSLETSNLVLDENLDTDGDGLSDYEETFNHGTSPYLEDTDSDGFSDYEELKLRLGNKNPNCAVGGNCLMSDNFFLEVDNNTVDDILGGEEGSLNTDGMGDITLPEGVNEADLKEALAGSITADDLRQLLLSSGADKEVLDQISDEDLLLSYQEILNNNQE
jgi:hypothetical protein